MVQAVKQVEELCAYLGVIVYVWGGGRADVWLGVKRNLKMR